MSVPGVENDSSLRLAIINGLTKVYDLRENIGEIAMERFVMTFENSIPLIDYYIQEYPDDLSKSFMMALRGLDLSGLELPDPMELDVSD